MGRPPPGVAAPRLVITGHSLGAGVASILALLLLPAYPNLRCFAYAPPSATFSPHLAIACSPFLTSVALGRDLVVSLSMPSVKAAVGAWVRDLETSPQSKCRLMAPVYAKLACNCFCPWRVRKCVGSVGGWEGSKAASSLQPVNNPPSSSALLQDLGGEKGVTVQISDLPRPTLSSMILDDSDREMGVPGRILHLVQVKEGPVDTLSLLCSHFMGWLFLGLCSPALVLKFLLTQDPRSDSWVKGTWDAGEMLGDSVASFIWTALGFFCCACQWRVRRGYQARWIREPLFFSRPHTPFDLSVRGAVEHLPHCYTEALKGVSLER